MGLTASEDSYTLAIFLNCSNIHYLLRVIFGSHFSTFSHILHKMVYKYQILIKMPEVLKKVDKMSKDYIFLHLSSFITSSTIKL
jgi:hypothetical protein